MKGHTHSLFRFSKPYPKTEVRIPCEENAGGERGMLSTEVVIQIACLKHGRSE